MVTKIKVQPEADNRVKEGDIIYVLALNPDFSVNKDEIVELSQEQNRYNVKPVLLTRVEDATSKFIALRVLPQWNVEYPDRTKFVEAEISDLTNESISS